MKADSTPGVMGGGAKGLERRPLKSQLRLRFGRDDFGLMSDKGGVYLKVVVGRTGRRRCCLPFSHAAKLTLEPLLRHPENC